MKKHAIWYWIITKKNIWLKIGFIMGDKIEEPTKKLLYKVKLCISEHINHKNDENYDLIRWFKVGFPNIFLNFSIQKIQNIS